MTAERKRKKKGAARKARQDTPSARDLLRIAFWTTLSVAFLAVLAALPALWFWARGEVQSTQQREIDLPTGASRLALAKRLHEAGAIGDPLLFSAYWTVFQPRARIEPGRHLLPADVTAEETLKLLARHSDRPRVTLNIPEGWSSFQIAKRLEAHSVCSQSELLRLAHSLDFARELGVSAASLEGYLFPDTYELFQNSDASTLLGRLVERARQQHQILLTEQAQRFAALERRFGFGLHEVITLASIVEREAANPDEQATMASVFFNRLRDESFRPQHMLQSDPTAGYGCLKRPELASCAGYDGRITPEMLRDRENPYNSYRHAGLPPGPIGNPGLWTLRAVLNPANTEYFFFVGDGHGKHVFSRSFAEHEAAVAALRRAR